MKAGSELNRTTEVRIIRKLSNEKLLMLIAYINICVIWGASNLATRIGVSSLHPFVFACLRFMLSGAVLGTLAVLRGGRLPHGAREIKSLFIIGFLMNFLTNGCVVVGSKLVDSGIVTILLSTIPIFTIIIEALTLRGYRLSLKGLAGAIGGFAGIALIALGGFTNSKSSISGVITVISGAVFWSVGSVYSKRNPVSGSIFAHTAVEALFASFLFWVASELTGGFDLSKASVYSLLPVVYLAVFDSAIGFLSYIWLLKKLPSTKVCTYAYINPVVALILGRAVLKEPLTPQKLVGMAIILLSVILMQRDKSSSTQPSTNKQRS